MELTLVALERNRVTNSDMFDGDPFLVKAVAQRDGVIAVVAQSD